MDTESDKTRNQIRDETKERGSTRRAVLAASGAIALSGIAGCSALDGLLDRASEQVVGTTVSAPAAFYAGRASSGSSASIGSNYGTEDTMQFFGTGGIASNHGTSDDTQVFRTGPVDIRHVPATAQAESREIELEGWSISGATKAQDYNSSRSNKLGSEWWAGPDDDIDDDEEETPLLSVLKAEVKLLTYCTTAQNAVERREGDEAKRALDAFVATTEKVLRPALDRCGSGVCETIRENSDHRTKAVRTARDAVNDGNWDAAARELTNVEEIVLGDIERLDDELVERRPGRPRSIDIIGYLRDEPTIGERFTVCLPDASLPGDRGSLAEELTPSRVLAYFAASHDPDGVRAPFHDRYGRKGISYNDEGCIQIDGPFSLHRDISCGSILSAELDTYRTENRAIVGHSTEGGAVVSAAPTSADTDGKCVFVAADGTLSEARSLNDEGVYCWGQRRAGDNSSLYCWGQRRTAGEASGGSTLVCPVAVTPEDCPCPLPGLFYVRRISHDDQIIFAGGWMLDDGALYEDSATLLFDEGPAEVASVTPEDIESDDYDDRIVDQFSRDRSQQGSAVISGEFDTDADSLPAALQTDQGRRGLNAVNVKVTGKQGDSDDKAPGHASVAAIDAPLLHLANAAATDNVVKFKAGAELSKSVN